MNREKLVSEISQLIKKLESECPARKGVSLQEQQKELASEAVEVGLALKEQDWAELKEELGDVFWDWLTFCHIAEEKGLFSPEEVLEHLKLKIRERNPHIFGNETASTREEALEVKRKAKQAWKQKKAAK